MCSERIDKFLIIKSVALIPLSGTISIFFRGVLAHNDRASQEWFDEIIVGYDLFMHLVEVRA